ncbi:long-chain-fatty-acid--CoA ligase [Oceanibacterium hippocampi]|uniref:3-methylmercaptopropionyl-CoA ligase n=1 Tax=Oceanibacterium hippocampi TaxID=745714 RepID=A0A1Y5U0G4_9PROT|nr:long-chain-fatty-acid--CoA ligase [Oceanibacterium hippocampi]SLN73029.1 Long-chain-fatty-acid--CoA ligase FadD13 [Oceanibacterium hippocampi]
MTAALTVAEVTRRHAADRGGQTALVFGDRATDFATLDRLASQIANGLIAARLQAQARVAVLARNSDSYLEIMFGCAKANCVLVPVNWRLAPPEIAFIIQDADTEFLFVGPEFESILAVLEEAGRLPAHVVRLAESGESRYRPWRDRQSPADPGLVPAADDVVMQLYTSGTTGHPKGAQLTNGNVLGDLDVCIRNWDTRPGEDVTVVVMPLFHIAGIGWALHLLAIGGTCVVLPDVEPKAILDAIARHRVTTTILVPAVILMVLQDPESRRTDFSSLRSLFYGASPIPLDLLRRAMQVIGCQFIQLYGLTETTGAITYLAPGDHDPEGTARMRSCGREMEPGTVRVVDAEGNDVAPGEVGEVIYRGTRLMKGYWNLPQADAAAIRDGWFHSGDAGYVDPDGYVYIHDRVKDMIVSGGENVYPAEVESALFGHPDIADVAVIGVPDERWGETVKAIVVPAPGTSPSEADIIDFARGRIAGFKLPKSVDFVDALPRNPSGKILKRELRRPYWENRERQVN